VSRLRREQLLLDPERDADIIRWLAARKNKAAAIREAVRGGMDRGAAERIGAEEIRKIVREELQAWGGGDRGGAEKHGDAEGDAEAGAQLGAMFAGLMGGDP
jgi:hypothetical protein